MNHGTIEAERAIGAYNFREGDQGVTRVLVTGTMSSTGVTITCESRLLTDKDGLIHAQKQGAIFASAFSDRAENAGLT